MKKILKNVLSHTVTFVVAAIIFTLVGVYAATTFDSTQVTYSITGSSVTDVREALDELYTKTNTWMDPSTLLSNSTGRIFANQKGIIIGRNGNAYYIKRNNWNTEKDHLQQVFSGGSCSNVSGQYVDCSDSTFHCRVSSDGNVYCFVNNNTSGCSSLSGTMSCN